MISTIVYLLEVTKLYGSLTTSSCYIVAPIIGTTNTSTQEEDQTTLLLLLVGLELDVELGRESAVVGSLFEFEGSVVSPSTTSTVVASPVHAVTEHSFCVLECMVVIHSITKQSYINSYVYQILLRRW
jgi:hypothetical protein